MVVARSVPTLVPFSARERCRVVSAGARHSLVATDARNVYAFGCNVSGQLGTGLAHGQTLPTVVAALAGAEARCLSAGTDHSGLIDARGSVWCWGSNRHGQLGLSAAQAEARVPQRVHFPSSAAAEIACGAANTLVLGREGAVFVAGRGGAEGLRPVEGIATAVSVYCSEFMAALTREGVLYLWGPLPFTSARPTPLGEFEGRLREVALGRDFLILLDHNHQVHSRGPDAHGRRGCGETVAAQDLCSPRTIGPQAVRAVSCGADFVVCLAEARFPEARALSARESPRPEGSLEALRDFQRSMFDLLSDIRAKVPDIQNSVDPQIVDRLLSSEQRMNALFSPASGVRASPLPQSRASHVEERLRQFHRECAGEEGGKAYGEELAEMRRRMKLDNSNLLSLTQGAKSVGSGIAVCLRAIADMESAFARNGEGAARAPRRH